MNFIEQFLLFGSVIALNTWSWLIKSIELLPALSAKLVTFRSSVNCPGDVVCWLCQMTMRVSLVTLDSVIERFVRHVDYLREVPLSLLLFTVHIVLRSIVDQILLALVDLIALALDRFRSHLTVYLGR